MPRICVECGSSNLGMKVYEGFSGEEGLGGFARKECLDCGSTGPFRPYPREWDKHPYQPEEQS